MRQGTRIVNIASLLILVFFGVVLNLQRPPMDQTSKAFSGVFSLNWTAGYCYAMEGTQNDCDPSMLQLWDSKSFSIHGLWPSSRTLRIYQDFDLSYSQQDKKLIKQMWNLWPPQTNYPLKGKLVKTFDHYWLWDHQWNKHGKDFANILQVLYPQKYKEASNKVLQNAYFNYSLTIYSTAFKGLQKIPLFSSQTHFKRTPADGGDDFILNKQDLSELLKIPASNFLAKCQVEDVLSQVHICWRMQAKTGLYSLDCNLVQNETVFPLTDSCPPTFQFLSYGKYGKKKQRRVWKTPSAKQLQGDSQSSPKLAIKIQ